MLGEPGSGGLAEPGHDVEHAGRNLGLLDDLSEEKGREGRLLGRLEDHGVPASEGGGDLPGGHHEREVPGHDGAHDADRLAQRVAQVAAGEGELVGLALQLGHPARVVAEGGGRDRGVEEERLVDRLAVVEAVELGELKHALLDEVADLPKHLGALGGWQVLPDAGLEGGASRLHSAVDVLPVAFGDFGQDLARGGVDRVEGLAGRGLHPAAADEELLRLVFQVAGDLEVFGDGHAPNGRGARRPG